MRASEDERAREIVSSRRFDAPRETVWEAFRNPEALAEWWGPAGFTSAFQEFDFRSGGAWRFTMRAPDGAEFPMTHRFIELAPPERITLRHDHIAHGFTMFMRLEAPGTGGDGTTLTWRMLFDTAGEAAKVRTVIEGANEQNFDRLANYLSPPKS